MNISEKLIKIVNNSRWIAIRHLPNTNVCLGCLCRATLSVCFVNPLLKARGEGATWHSPIWVRFKQVHAAEEKWELAPFACSVGLTRPVCWFAQNSGRCLELARSPGEAVIGNTNLSSFLLTFSSSAPLPKPEARNQKRKRQRKGKTVEGEGTRGNVFLRECFA